MLDLDGAQRATMVAALQLYSDRGRETRRRRRQRAGTKR
jgi:hypothetical protein